jgi:hypothetical protein
VVAVTVHLPELLLSASGLFQRLGVAGVPCDVLVAAEGDDSPRGTIAAALARLEVPGLLSHRLALPAPFGPERADDLLAAMSELVGFDPEPGVFVLGPGVDGSAEQSRRVVAEAADRIATVYRLRRLYFTATSDVAQVDLELDGPEWTRKNAALDAVAAQVTPLSGGREFFGR